VQHETQGVPHSAFKKHAGFSVLIATITNNQLQYQLYIVMSGKVGGKSKSGKAAGGKAIGTSQSCSAKVALQFRVDCIHGLLKKGNYAQRVGAGCTRYVTRFFLSQLCTDSFKKSVSCCRP
jgi:hypothetical protein